MTLARTAVDSTAKAYWEDFFGDYGKAWVRDIPRRVASALGFGPGRQAATGGGRAGPGGLIRVEHYGHAVLAGAAGVGGADDGLVVEGRIQQGGPGGRSRVFAARFSSDGELQHLSTVDVAGGPAGPGGRR